MECMISMIEDTKIIDEVCRLKLQGMTTVKIAHVIARVNPNYFRKNRKEKNISSTDVLKIVEGLKAEGRLPPTVLDDLKKKIGEKGRSNSKLKKPRKKVAIQPQLTFNF